jgi:hypothetical protein
MADIIRAADDQKPIVSTQAISIPAQPVLMMLAIP